MFAMSALSQTGVALTDALQPGYDEQGNYLGYAAMKADIQKRFSEAKTCVQMLSDEYERDAIHLLQLSSKRKDLDMKQAAVKQVEADIHDERAKLTSLWSRTRSILEKYLTQSPSDATLQNEISQLEVPVELESLNAIMGTLERTLLKIARESETANKTQNSVAQDVSSAEAVLYQSKSNIAKMETTLRNAKNAAASQADDNLGDQRDPQEIFNSVKAEFANLVTEHGLEPEANLLNLYDKHKNRKDDSFLHLQLYRLL